MLQNLHLRAAYGKTDHGKVAQPENRFKRPRDLRHPRGLLGFDVQAVHNIINRPIVSQSYVVVTRNKHRPEKSGDARRWFFFFNNSRSCCEARFRCFKFQFHDLNFEVKSL